ncbi:MAG: cysteine desulfurase [Ignavibacteriae bacterium]|nr:cysteine desulfurase [Ignavibacteriota bacterium]MCB9214696.1 cysteine desulfurase [Ignavibacteria bacterium]
MAFDLIYLDNSATTELDPQVVEIMNRFREENFANAGSVHRSGQRARVALEDGRDTIARCLGAEPKEIVFTSGGTEANNYALKGYAFHAKATTGSWPTIITDRTEHHAILHPAEFLESLGLPVRYVEVTREGRVTPENLDQLMQSLPNQPAPPLISIMHANNETGTINPIRELAEVTHERGGVIHTDAVQSFGKIPCKVAELGVDMMTLSAHKIHGPKGVGLLYVNKELELESLIHGGAQERDRRGGTEAVELVVGFAEAARIAEENREEAMREVERLSHRLRERLKGIEGVCFVTPEAGALPNILNITFNSAEHLDGEGLIVGMDIQGVAVSNGSACTSGSMQPSHVLLAMGYPPAQAKAAVRFSLSRFTTEAEIDRATEAMAEQFKIQQAKLKK